MDFQVLTSTGPELIMRTEEGRVVLVLPAPPESLPQGGVPAQPAPSTE